MVQEITAEEVVIDEAEMEEKIGAVVSAEVGIVPTVVPESVREPQRLGWE